MKALIAAVILGVAAVCPIASAGHIPVGNPIAVIKASSIGMQAMVFQGGPDLLNGTEWPPELRHGPALYPGTSYPCTKGTVAIAGHHLTNSRPFLHIAQLRIGSLIRLNTRYGGCSYRVRVVFPVTDDAIQWLYWGGGNGYRLVLTSCDQVYNSQGVQVNLLRTVVLAEEDKK